MLLACVITLIYPGGLLGGTLHTLSGWVELAPAAYRSQGDYVLRNDPFDRVRAILADPDHRLVKNLPDRCLVTARITQPRGPEDEPVFRVTSQETAMIGDFSPDPVGSPGWTASDGEHYSAAMNVVSRISSFNAENSLDADGDGVPDTKDSFPGRPEEWVDSDRDGIGNNADPDDDNDGMSDSYEVQNGLKPLVADALDDADGDGMSNDEEAIAGTRANDRQSIFMVRLAVNQQTGQIAVHWPGVATRLYGVQTANTPAGPWQAIYSRIRPAADGDVSRNMAMPKNQPVFIRTTVTKPSF